MKFIKRLLIASLSIGLLLNGTLLSQAQALTRCVGSEVNIVAHQDDDILFMNPDISESIQQRRCVETIYLTGGEWDGQGYPSREDYAAARDEGTRAAYATMAHVANSWSRSTELFGQNTVEVDTLIGMPNVKLAYLSLHDGGNSTNLNNLTDLYVGNKTTISSFVPKGSPAGISPVSYTKQSLTETLLRMLNRVNASSVRTQDYLPDIRLGGDHGDHVYGALFAVDAAHLRNYQHMAVVSYRDYNISFSPVNLSAAQTDAKNQVLNAYKAHDAIFALPTDQAILAARMYYRWPVPPTWTARNLDGSLQTFDIQNGKLVTWHQNVDGSWSNMQSLGNTSLQPGLAVVPNADGSLQVYVVKQTIGSTGFVQQEVQTIKQTTPNGAFGGWLNLGSPAKSSFGTYDIGPPAAVMNADGRMEVFVRDSNAHLATSFQMSNGAYTGWMALPGEDITEAPAAILRADGRIEVFAATRGPVLHWLQRQMNGPILSDPYYPSVHAVGGPSAGFNQDGRPQLFYRHPGGQTYTTWQGANGMWINGELNLGGQSSQGAPAIALTNPVWGSNSRLVLFERNQTGFERLAQISQNSSFQSMWTSSAGFSQHSPSAYRDGRGVVHLLSVSQDGGLSDLLY